MYIFEAHYTNMDNNEEITRKIEFDGQFMENDKECYMYLWKNGIYVYEYNQTIMSRMKEIEEELEQDAGD